MINQKPVQYFKCSSCGIIIGSDETITNLAHPDKCCNTSSEEPLVPWPSAPVSKLMHYINAQDLNSYEGLQAAVFCLYSIYEVLFEQTSDRLFNNSAINENKQAPGGAICRDILPKLFDEMIDNPFQKYIRIGGFEHLIEEFRSFVSLRDRIVHNIIKDHTIPEIVLVRTLIKECFSMFVFINNEITNVPKKQSIARKISKVLVIDDDVDATEIMEDIIRTQGVEVETANCGWDGVNKYKSFRPDIVLLDIDMPDINGLEVIVEIMKFDKNASVYFLTGIGGEVLKEKVKELGAKGHFGKPVLISDLISLVTGKAIPPAT